jgi:hypothetical protein
MRISAGNKVKGGTEASLTKADPFAAFLRDMFSPDTPGTDRAGSEMLSRRAAFTARDEISANAAEDTAADLFDLAIGSMERSGAMLDRTIADTQQGAAAMVTRELTIARTLEQIDRTLQRLT